MELLRHGRMEVFDFQIVLLWDLLAILSTCSLCLFCIIKENDELWWWLTRVFWDQESKILEAFHQEVKWADHQPQLWMVVGQQNFCCRMQVHA